MSERDARTGRHGYDDQPARLDKLGLDQYFTGLARFIESCPTPMTIAIQGGWGSGKTSAMNIIRQKMEAEASDQQGGNKALVHIDFNTWQYARAARGSLFIPLLHQLLQSIDRVVEDKVEEKKKDNKEKKSGLEDRYREEFPQAVDDKIYKGVFKTILGATALFTDTGDTIVRLLTAIGDGVRKNRSGEQARDDADQRSAGFTYIVEMKSLLKRKIKFLVADPDCQISRLIFYIDDLDRLGPEEAVEFLEDLKNYIECEHCVFVLALDHEIVRRGLRKKYGDDIEDAYAHRFFDKIIQMPFNLPCNRYDIRQYVDGLLNNDPAHDSNHDPDAETFAGIIKGFGDTNPRTIKRVFNIMSMYEKIENQSYRDHRELLLAMLLLQTNHEDLYKQLMEALREDLSMWEWRILFGAPDISPENLRAIVEQTNAWFEADRDDRRDQAVVDQMAEVFFDGGNRTFKGYELLFEIAGATSITGADLGSMPQAVEETKQLVQDYAQYLKFSPSPNVKQTQKTAQYEYFYRHGDAAHKIRLEISLPGKYPTHVNLAFTDFLGTDPYPLPEDHPDAAFEPLFSQGERFAVNPNPIVNASEMYILCDKKRRIVLRNVSVENSASMRLAGRIMRNIARCGQIFPE